MVPDIRNIQEKKLVGKRLKMSLDENRTFELWKSFMPRRKEIKNNLTNDLISLQVYNNFSNENDFDSSWAFEKWAAIEVADFDSVPDGLETYLLDEGLYAVFLHKGAASTGATTFQYIFGTWLPNSAYALDKRAHFEVLGEKYKNDDPNSEEEIWIPIRAKG